MDRSGIDYKLKFIGPGVHMQLAKKLDLKNTSVPILVTDDGAIQGSSAILDWIEENAADGVSLSPPSHKKDIAEIEGRLDDIAGIHLRRYYYSEAMVDHPATVKPLLTKGIPLPQKILVNSIWSKIRALMIKGLDLGPEQRLHSRDIVAKELDWLDGLLSGGKTYLVGDSFTRADLTAASLLGPLAVPAEHPLAGGFELPPLLASEVAEWEARPCMTYIRDIYKNHRN